MRLMLIPYGIACLLSFALLALNCYSEIYGKGDNKIKFATMFILYFVIIAMTIGIAQLG